MTSMLVFQYRLISFFLCKEALMTFFLMLFLILFFGVLFNRLAKLIKIPSLVFYLLFGILLSFIDSKVSNDSFHLLDTGLMSRNELRLQTSTGPTATRRSCLLCLLPKAQEITTSTMRLSPLSVIMCLPTQTKMVMLKRQCALIISLQTNTFLQKVKHCVTSL